MGFVLRRFARNESGQDLVEYSLLIALMAIVSAGIVNSVGTGYVHLWSTATSMLANAASLAGS